ncbi:PAS domain-containing protein [Lewinella sp. 4G2]|uniref:PAS domain-containing protein n=1 Tax=Lewinella sp. 4G2 TaxID=1803372 RepID=UPI0007B4F15F|nr:PAS domain-containing protein [Lewinella sp. 4G2]OAV44373.1 AraC family transcriptional regulator [Lewinella sp. 4G2]
MNYVATILTDAKQSILWVNKDFEYITGYELHEVLGMKPGQVLQGPGTEPDVVESIRKGLASRESFKETITNYRKNGEPYLCRLVIHPIFDKHDELVNFLAFEVDHGRTPNDSEISVMNLDHRYRTSSLRGATEVRLFERIKSIVQAEKLYLDANLTLRKLSIRLDTNTKYLSQVINHYGDCNFLSFINNYRIEEVKRQIDRGDYYNQTFFGIAQRSGFKNKSTFYKVFKDFTELTPKAYAEEMELRRAATGSPSRLVTE